MNGKKTWIKSNWLVLLTGFIVGVAALVLQKAGNPGNMGFCIACFERDIAGALGLHSAAKVQYFRPEIIGIILGALIAAVCAGEFRGKGGSSPVLRFLLGAGVMIGALIFLGCPLRMVIRIGGGDPNALVGLVGFIAGILIGVLFLKNGFDLGRAYPQNKSEGAAFPASLTLLFILCAAGVIGVASTEGPGSLRAPVYLSLLAGLAVGALAQRSRFCMAGGVRDAVMFRQFGLIAGFAAVIVTVLAGNLILGFENYKGFTFVGQPIASADGLWNFLGMVIVGWGSALLGGCPLRQLVLTGEGNTDSAVTVMGMMAGAAFSHNFGLASGASVLAEDGTVTGGSAPAGHIAVGIVLAALLVISLCRTFLKKEKKDA